MIFLNIKQFFIKNKNIIWLIGLFLIVFGLFTDVTFAESTAGGTNSTGNTSDSGGDSLFSKKGIIEIINMGIQLIGVFLAMGTYLATMFLSPEWINGSLFGLDEKLKGIWILVSNLVYFVFAFILIWIAFMNIIGKTGDQYQLKQALPKFIVGVLIVPFSWFLVQFILSISAILTVSALTLPYDTFKDYGVQMGEIKAPTDCRINLNQIKDSSGKSSGKGSDQLIDCDFEVISGEKATDSIFGIFSLYTYGILKFDSYDDLSKSLMQEGNVATLGDIVIKVLFSALFVIVYGILIITLTIVLLIRGIYIWIYIMLSPLFGLMYFFGKSDGGEGFFEKFNIKEFIALAMVPVYTMLALSFGLLFINVIGTGLVSSSSMDNKIHLGKDDKGESYFTLGNHKLTIVGPVSETTQEDLTEMLGVMEKEGGGALGIVGNMILKILGIVVLWGTVMAAMRASKITKQITEPIHQFGTKVGEIAASGPGNMPIFGKGMSMKSMSQAASSVHSTINQRSSTKGTEIADGFMKIDDHSKAMSTYSQVGDDNKKKAEAIDYIIKNVKNANSSQIKDYNKLLRTIGYEGDIKLVESENEQITAGKLSKILNSDKISFNGKGNEAYKERRLKSRIETSDSGTAPVEKKGVGDNTTSTMTKKQFDESDGVVVGSEKNIKVLKDEGKLGIGSIMIKKGNGEIVEHRLNVDITGKFEDAAPEDKEEIIAFYNKLGKKDGENINDILKEFGVGDGDDIKKAIKAITKK